MELSFLHMLQYIHNNLLDSIMVFITHLGDNGTIWILLGLIFITIPRYRHCGIMILIALSVNYLLGDMILKNIFARPRPFQIDNSISLLIPKPSSYSFPSGHSSAGFAAAVTIFINHKKAGILPLCLAVCIAFSRLYLFVHYPTDVLAGIILGTFVAICLKIVTKKILQIYNSQSF